MKGILVGLEAILATRLYFCENSRSRENFVLQNGTVAGEELQTCALLLVIVNIFLLLVYFFLFSFLILISYHEFSPLSL